jgi:predicted GTPase
VKVVVGGPPNSGKSTFTAILRKHTRQMLGSHATDIVQSLTLDLVDNSVEWMDDPTGETDRRIDREFNEENAEARRDRFEDIDAELVIADAPGQIDELTRLLTGPADALIIVSNDQDGIEEWREFADEEGLEVFAEFETFLPDEDTEPDWDPDDRTGTLRGLDRDVYKTEGLDGLERETVVILRDLTDALLEEALG